MDDILHGRQQHFTGGGADDVDIVGAGEEHVLDVADQVATKAEEVAGAVSQTATEVADQMAQKAEEVAAQVSEKIDETLAGE